MKIIEALNKIPEDKLEIQSLPSCFLAGEVKKKTASITFQTTSELVFQMNAAAISGERPKKIGIIFWVETEAWDRIVSPAQNKQGGGK